MIFSVFEGKFRHSADDFVCCFQYKNDAELFYEPLKKRMNHFGLSLEESKTQLIYFGRFAAYNLKRQGKKPETFDFLGFTQYCSKSRNGNFRVKEIETYGKKNCHLLVLYVFFHPYKCMNNSDALFLSFFHLQ